MGGIRTSAAAELLGVSPSTLRTWERRLGFPQPYRTAGNHRQYDLSEIEALREALGETGNISSAVAIVRTRGRGPSSPSRLLRAFDSFDEVAADRELEESLALRSTERSVDELLLPALELAAGRDGREAEFEHACRWAIGWLHTARRLAPPATRTEGVLLLDSGSQVGLEGVYVQALELFLRRAGLRVLLLSADLAEARFANALRALRPAAVVICGSAASLDVLGGPLRRVLAAAPNVRLAGYRAARLVSGRSGIPTLGDGPAEAIATLPDLLAVAPAPLAPAIDAASQTGSNA
jgi:MerR family transcriptional regulator, light-induced transcriptional regulator